MNLDIPYFHFPARGLCDLHHITFMVYLITFSGLHYSMEEIDSACQDAWNGIPSRRPVMEMTIPSSLDKTISPPGIAS